MTCRAWSGARLGRSPHLVIEDRCAPEILGRLVREAEPLLKYWAAGIAADFPAAVPDMVQEARIKLWQLDLSRFPQRDVKYLERILYTCMIHVHRKECRAGFTTGWSKHK